LTQKGDTVPSNAIKAGNRALGRSTQNVPNPGCGHGYTGWIDIHDDGTLGPLQYAVASGPQNSTGSFEIAYCHSCKLCPKVYNATFHPGPGCPNCTKPVNPPPPPPPLSTKPCIRFGHSIPVRSVFALTLPPRPVHLSLLSKCRLSTATAGCIGGKSCRRNDSARLGPVHLAHVDEFQVLGFQRLVSLPEMSAV